MPVYQPTAIIGNSRTLVTLGARAELMTFFYPRIDFPQNLREGMPAVYFYDAAGGGRLSWSFDPEWSSDQHYLGRTNLLETTLQHTSGLQLNIIDFVHPTEPVLVRRFEATNRSGAPMRAKLFQYLALQLGEVIQKNATHFHIEDGVGVAYWRDICLAVGSDVIDDYGCGRAFPGSPNSAKQQMEWGQLNRQEDEIGNVDLALGWSVALAPGESTSRTLYIAANADEIAAVARFTAMKEAGWQELADLTRAYGDEFVARAHPLHVEPDLEEAYYRCLLAIDLMTDGDYGSMLAAPEFDPNYERSGGYGYCWPRDAVEVCLGLEAAGYPEYLRRFLDWTEDCQRPEGYWEQRYWLGGQRAPSWCTREDRLQIDQTAAVLYGMGLQARALSGTERMTYLGTAWEVARAAADYLVRSISPSTGLHAPASDLWETFRGSFTYSNAAISCALQEAGFLARAVGDDTRAAAWEQQAAAIKQAVLARLWRGDCFARGLDAEGRLDTTADASILGLVTPFAFLRLDNPEERAMAESMMDSLVRRIGRPVAGAEALLRFEGDPYAGGGPGAVPTLWLARARLMLALADPTNGTGVRACREQSVAALRAVLALGTPTGMLPEMSGPGPGEMWAVPHAWCMASFITTAVLLDKLPVAEAGA